MKKIIAILSLSLATCLFVFACGPVEDELDGGSDYDAGNGSDASTGPACGDPCTDTDMCDGDTLKYCDTTVQCDDCAGYGLHCALWTAAYGHECLASSGESCAPDFPNNTDSLSGCDPALGLTCTGGTCQ